MGEYLSKACCADKGNVITFENLTSRINSPLNHEFQRIVFELPNNEVKLNEQLVAESPDKKPKMIRRSISGLSESKLEERFVRPVKRSLTYKAGENFLRRAKKRMLSIASAETPMESQQFAGFAANVQKYEDLHISIPDGDLDCDF